VEGSEGGSCKATGQRVAPKAQRAVPSAEQMGLGEWWKHVVRGGRVDKATTILPTNSHPNPHPQPVTEAPEKPLVTATKETARPQKPTAAPKRASGKSKKKAAAIVKTAAATPTTPSMVVRTQSPTFLLEEISDLLDQLPTRACVELTRRLLTSISSLPKGAACRRACLQTVILFVA